MILYWMINGFRYNKVIVNYADDRNLNVYRYIKK